MTYDDEIILIKEDFVTDEIGNPISKPIENKILCNVKSISQSEFYKAASLSMKPSIKFVIHKFEYNNELKVKYKNDIYNVIKTYAVEEEIELTCEKL